MGVLIIVYPVIYIMGRAGSRFSWHRCVSLWYIHGTIREASAETLAAFAILLILHIIP